MHDVIDFLLSCDEREVCLVEAARDELDADEYAALLRIAVAGVASATVWA